MDAARDFETNIPPDLLDPVVLESLAGISLRCALMRAQPDLRKMELDDEERGGRRHFEIAVLDSERMSASARWVASSNLGFTMSANVPDLVRRKLADHVDFQRFRKFWLDEVSTDSRVVDPFFEMPGGQDWIDWLAGYVSAAVIFRKAEKQRRPGRGFFLTL